jgi:NAD-dependent dihydropyrimidine dehydrogenase PreA subunit
VIDERCTRCDACVKVCPSNVFEARPGAAPFLARPSDCQTCFLCELYCKADALYVGADCERAQGIGVAEALASGTLGRYRRDSGWDEFAGDPRYANEHWRMEGVFARARKLAEIGFSVAPGGLHPNRGSN